MLSRIKLVVGLAALALALVAPGAAQAKPHHGNHCGRGHAKHSKAVGKTCHKQNSRSSQPTAGGSSTVNAPSGNSANEPAENEPAENEPAENENEANDDQGDAQDQNEMQNENENENGGNNGRGSDG